MGRTPIQRLELVAVQGAIANGEGFSSPEDDWAPILLYDSPSGPGGMPLILEDKPAAMALVREHLFERGARAAALILSSWMAPMAPGLVESLVKRGIQPPRPSTMEERIEMLMILLADRAQAKSMMARINRDGENPPTLGPWTKPSMSFESPWLDAMTAGMVR